jgi:hypothetical protein
VLVVGIFLSRTKHHGGRLFKLSVVNDYGSVATLVRQRRRNMFPGVGWRRGEGDTGSYCRKLRRHIPHSRTCQSRISRKVLLLVIEECSAITHVLGKFPTSETGNTCSATNFTFLYFSVFSQITEFSYSPRLVGHTIFYLNIILSELNSKSND